MTKLFSIILLSTFTIAINAKSQSTDSLLLFYPLQIGNYWQYDWKNYITNPASHMHYQTHQVLFDTLMPNGFKFHAVFDSKYQRLNYFRVDTLNAKVCIWTSSGFEYAIYDLKSPTRVDTVFGIPTKVIRTGLLDSNLGIAFGFGKVWEEDYTSGWPYKSTLVYANINGKQYGSLLSVSFRSQGIREYQLFQNYPNPFNPSTTIRYYLSKPSNVTLKVFNILGQEVYMLVSNNQSAGEHVAYFSGERLTSGVYMYQLSANNYSETKIMILSR